MTSYGDMLRSRDPGGSVKVYRLHNCLSTHHTWTTFAKCIWPRAIWVYGDGPYASVASCGRGTTVVLCLALEDAQMAKRVIDNTGCGGQCWRRHEIVRLSRGGA